MLVTKHLKNVCSTNVWNMIINKCFRDVGFSNIAAMNIYLMFILSFLRCLKNVWLTNIVFSTLIKHILDVRVQKSVLQTFLNIWYNNIGTNN